MRTDRLRRLPVAVALLLALGACGGGKRSAESLPHRFEPTILENGTKLFAFTLPLPRPRPGQPVDSERQQRWLRDDGPIERLLGEIIAANGYCRDGWWIIDRYHTLRAVHVRGECRDAADAADLPRYNSSH